MSQNDNDAIHQDDGDTDNQYFEKGIDEVYEETFGNEPDGDTVAEEVNDDEAH